MVRQRLSGASELGLPGSGSNHITPLLSNIPVDGDTTREPKIDSRVWVTEQMLPRASITQKCVVQPGACGDSWSPMSCKRLLNALLNARA